MRHATEHISGVPLAVFVLPLSVEMVGMLVQLTDTKKVTLAYHWSHNGLSWSKDSNVITLSLRNKKKEDLSQCSGFCITIVPHGYALTYIRHTESKKGLQRTLVTLVSKNLYDWTEKSEEDVEGDRAALVYDSELDRYISYRDGLFIRSFSSPKFGVFPKTSTLLATSRNGNFDAGRLSVLGALFSEHSIALIYDASQERGTTTLIQAGVLIFDTRYPSSVRYRSEAPLWQTLVDSAGTVSPVGAVLLGDTTYMYWYCDGVIILGTWKAPFSHSATPTAHLLSRSKHNPIISPRAHHSWEREGTFNPAAFMGTDGCVHVLYRAIGGDGVSRVGYAHGKPGSRFLERYPYPVYDPSRAVYLVESGYATYNPSYYTSGGSWVGAEDPRTVLIDDVVYMTYVAFGGWHSMRMALVSLPFTDFKRGNWKWSDLVYLSPPGETHKNWVLFPEKIDGKFAVLHSISPDVKVDYFPSLELDNTTTYITSRAPTGGRPGFWDSRVRGAGPPPIKTKLGWLVLYHANDTRDPHRYKLGAMILDKKDPQKVLYRTHAPILSPDEWYENDGKPGVVYASGAVCVGDTLHIYYGGADRVVAEATTSLSALLEFVQKGKEQSYKLDTKK